MKQTGFGFDALNKALKKASSDLKDPSIHRFSHGVDYAKSFGECDEGEHEDRWPRTPGSSDSGDPYDSIIKPSNVPVWDHAPATEEEEALYHGVHIHSETNPLGLHTHIKGGELRGGHTHGPQNRFGVHHHRSEPLKEMISLDGKHVHDHINHPCGYHEHGPENFS